ncbi:MAG: L-tyrosine decarboxylase, PLP-dependent protein MfnA [Candidatus Methanohalarchaeum thermophilum]|uniref:L-tyrosine decarboxylase, PLP-dependent protein MfnA n=1 Tax=Methanohalarchaeum thermophilum TaxID=1903181 RepID=A0A1Q6DX63_METT1|nr:MAG: L-tyrosine decarboxylase, PLP-dependent protein MfnA [Candidatus Methanohalarchaeum thermophilum]
MVDKIVDLRSDTVTKPTDEMRREMKKAEVGDDVFKEDPTVSKLENKAAEIFDKEAGLFVSSGTQGNLISLLTHAQSGEEVILGRDSHIFNYEVGGFARLGGLSARPIKEEKGRLPLEKLIENIKGSDIHFPEQSLVCLENTHNGHGGVPVSGDYIEKIGQICMQKDLKLHIDGARIFNASVYLEEDVSNLCEPADSIQFCLSKGLSAPIGSIIVGSRDFISRARKNRKIVGGGMRQVGVIAATGLISLDKMIDRLKKDHEKANRLAEGLKDLGFEINPNKFKTNIVYLSLDQMNYSTNEFLGLLKEKGIKALSHEDKIRFVTHREVSKEDINYCLEAIDNLIH